jgi:hypothetical protein
VGISGRLVTQPATSDTNNTIKAPLKLVKRHIVDLPNSIILPDSAPSISVIPAVS